MGLVLDLAVIAIAAVVVGSLATLAWTIAVSSVRAVRTERHRVAIARGRVAAAEDRLRALARRGAPPPEPIPQTPGGQHDA